MIHKILFPVDFSNRTVQAARYVEFFVRRFHAELMLLHVIGNEAGIVPFHRDQQRTAELQQFLAAELNRFNPDRVCLAGHPAAEILAIANHWKPDLVMMPTRGAGPYHHLSLGSVTSEVAARLPRPLWTDVHPEPSPSPQNLAIRKILCAVGHQDDSVQVIEFGARMACEYGAELGIVHAAPPATPLRQARSDLNALEDSLGYGASTFVITGDAPQVVVEVARLFSADLLVMKRQPGRDEHSLRTTSAILRNSPCPVISV